MPESPLNKPDYFLNRELSVLAFNARVLELAQDQSLPVLERLKYLCISSANLDEFFEVRVGSIREQQNLGVPLKTSDDLSAVQLLAAISERAHQLVECQYQVLNDAIIPALAEQGIHFVRRGEWTEAQLEWLSNYFDQELRLLLSPLSLDPSHPFPNVINKSLNFVVNLSGVNAFGREVDMAIVQAPRTLPRIIRLPADIAPSADSFVFLSSILHAFIARLFPGLEVLGCHQFRLTRNSNMYVDEEEIDDLLKAMQGELPHRNYGSAVRLEVAESCPDSNIEFLLEQFHLTRAELYQVNGPVNLHRLMTLYDFIARPELHYPAFAPGSLERAGTKIDLFERISERDILIHQPYQAFTPVIDFLSQAAVDPTVLAIKLTLYRTGKKSVLVDQLIKAARLGKDVTAVVELRARFDEEANIDLTNQLQQAGVHVVYGVVGYKTHAKICMVVRREQGKLRQYVHMSTGNYHAGTAKAYTDFALFTCNPDIGEDVHKVFHLLTGLGRMKGLKCLLDSPFRLHNSILNKIEREITHAKAGKKALIMARMNALIEPQVIEALYRASNAGVKIELIVRGICCLRPGIIGVSDNIRVRSVMGRFLEHPRVFYFYNDNQEELYCSSADWMPRNFFRRVEIAFPILDPELRARVRHEAFEIYLQDNTYAWLLDATGHYERLQPAEWELPLSAQQVLMDTLGEEGQRQARLMGVQSSSMH
ncbi:MAG: polyphosphate kinase 1 [Thiofilum sp.]|uniref:polyphosphate kinase 1 n=1 Tax=Thiofilum sp. TaxID=2212733 RepID=UPI0025CC7234|nr:polyphosphate kinase 1 [Thiofilum sp.]MBK8452549.1 polyphosphate kinase 1 [Thiofilum sp.]